MPSMSLVTTILLSFLSLTQGTAILNARQSFTPPAECDVIPTWEVTSFNWFNSSNNLDCVTESNAPPEGVCFNSTSSGLVPCDGNLGPCDRCGIGACYTGLPLQPAGFGPPDTIAITTSVSGYESCFESNPQSIRRYEVGDGTLFCGGVAYRINFVGDSNTDVSTGHIDFSPIQSWNCNNGSTIRASGSVDFEIDCSRDAGNNATCVIPGDQSIVIPILSYTIT
ncbi:hypothetical protein J7T55_015343 [Diaporthe amygdali]|uniref:uncharacterized protein n=1 Tax=Phomopsis amygdali TaxID=1214568 RepID=UPI0022FDF2EF|nr:uncharacterized protein J7T55_015343 [Diaporthe amygdali]KAJ0120613.1 hypothetical protein J7T55_015343 [Diaporthe amygdali]